MWLSAFRFDEILAWSDGILVAHETSALQFLLFLAKKMMKNNVRKYEKLLSMTLSCRFDEILAESDGIRELGEILVLNFLLRKSS